MRRRNPGRAAYISSIRQKNVISHFIALSLIQIIGPIHYNARFVKLLILDSEIWPEMSSPDAPRRHKGAMLVKFGCLWPTLINASKLAKLVKKWRIHGVIYNEYLA